MRISANGPRPSGRRPIGRCLLLAASAAVAVGVLASHANAYAPMEAVPPGEPAATAEPPGLRRTVPPLNGVRSNEKSGRPVLPVAPADDEDPTDPHSGENDAIAAPAATEATLADVRYGADGLPAPVAATRSALIEAARSGDIEALRPIFRAQRGAPIVAGFDQVEDPVESLKLQSGDPEGREILAILLELLEAGHVHVGGEKAGTYVWPYFAEVPLTELAPKHYVELYRILTAIDVEELERVGGYTFFRVGISADGRVRYFTADALE